MAAGYLTEGRSIEIELDHAETIPVEPFFARSRERMGLKPDTVSDVEQLASGIWQLKPVETNLFTTHETTAGQASIVRLADCETIPLMAEIPMQRQYPELTGLSPAAGVSSSGDHFLLKRVPASSSWNQSLIVSQVAPTLSPTPNYPLDPVCQFKNDGSRGIWPEDAGWLIRWQHPGNPQSYVDYIFSFFFGGAVSSRGFGQFCLTIGGAGRAKLHEWIDGAWSLVHEWIYAPPELITRQVHAMRIIPHYARYLELRCSINEAPSPVGAMTQLRPPGLRGREIRTQAEVYEATNRGSLPAPPGGLAYPMTGPGGFRMDCRRDLRFPFQICKISYPTTGYLIDAPFRIPNTPTTTHVLEVVPHGMVRYLSGTVTPQQSFTPQPYNAVSGAALGTQTETWTELSTTRTINGWTVPAAPAAVAVKITFDNPTVTHTSPWLAGYEARRRGDFAALAPTPIKINSSHYRQSPATRIDLDQGDEDPSHARASLRVSDLVNRVSILANRGDIPVRVTTTYTTDQTKKSVLWEGYIVKSEATLRGNLAAQYPSPDWHDYRCEALGKFKRMAERDFPRQALWFGDDTRPEAPPASGRRPPWKVTDAIRYLITEAGFDSSQIDVPDLPIRFWTNNSASQDHLQIQIGDSLFDWIVEAAKTYLNYFLVWDANAGSSGKWRLRPAPRYGASACWTYVFGGPAPGKLPHLSASYGSNTTFVEKGSYERWVVPAEFNWIQMTGILEGGSLYTVQARNPKSYNRPGEATADSTDPDYLGRLRPVYGRPDPRLCTREAVKFATRLVFERAGRAAIYARFTSPAVLIDAATLEPTVYTTYARRPHLFGDIVTLDGSPYFVRNCRLEITKDFHQIQHIEAQMLRAPLA